MFAHAEISTHYTQPPPVIFRWIPCYSWSPKKSPQHKNKKLQNREHRVNIDVFIVVNAGRWKMAIGVATAVMIACVEVVSTRDINHLDWSSYKPLLQFGPVMTARKSGLSPIVVMVLLCKTQRKTHFLEYDAANVSDVCVLNAACLQQVVFLLRWTSNTKMKNMVNIYP